MPMPMPMPMPITERDRPFARFERFAGAESLNPALLMFRPYGLPRSWPSIMCRVSPATLNIGPSDSLRRTQRPNTSKHTAQFTLI